jgi:transposase
MTRQEITEQENNEINEIMKRTKLKRVDKRLEAITLRYKGHSNKEIGEKLNFTPKYVSQLVSDFKRLGAEEYARHKYGGNNQAIDTAKEKEILAAFMKKAESGQIVTAAEIKRAFDEFRGKDTGRGYIYMLLKRHNWRMVMPRSKHPKKASEADIEASKKLPQPTGNWLSEY